MRGNLRNATETVREKLFCAPPALPPTSVSKPRGARARIGAEAPGGGSFHRRGRGVAEGLGNRPSVAHPASGIGLGPGESSVPAAPAPPRDSSRGYPAAPCVSADALVPGTFACRSAEARRTSSTRSRTASWSGLRNVCMKASAIFQACKQGAFNPTVLDSFIKVQISKRQSSTRFRSVRLESSLRTDLCQDRSGLAPAPRADAFPRRSGRSSFEALRPGAARATKRASGRARDRARPRAQAEGSNADVQSARQSQLGGRERTCSRALAGALRGVAHITVPPPGPSV